MNHNGNLIITRKRGQRICIGRPGELVTVTVLEIRGDKIRLAVRADKSVPVHREEIWVKDYPGCEVA